jgi:hypothetical protein
MVRPGTEGQQNSSKIDKPRPAAVTIADYCTRLRIFAGQVFGHFDQSASTFMAGRLLIWQLTTSFIREGAGAVAYHKTVVGHDDWPPVGAIVQLIQVLEINID